MKCLLTVTMKIAKKKKTNAEVIIFWILPRIYKPPVLNVADTPGSTDKIYGPSVRLPTQKKKNC